LSGSARAAPPRAEFVGEPLRFEVDGHGDDLLTAGLGLVGLRGPPPAFADPAAPTWRERRRRAIHAAYRGLVDVTGAGGFGRLYGPIADRRVAGVEWLATVRTPDGRGVTTVLLQVPAAFNMDAPCLVAVASSGSRGVYGALPTAAEWALQRGFAVVHTDKGTGTGIWDVDQGRGYRTDGALTRDAADPTLSFSPGPAPPDAAAGEHALAFKHAHSGQNPEADWGVYLLQAIDAAFQLLNRGHGTARRRPLTPDATLVMAVGISNGGASVLRALERDRAGWIGGALAVEPNAMVAGRTAGLEIRQGDLRLVGADIAPYDYTSLHALYQPAAVLAPAAATEPLAAASAAARPALEAWCRALQAVGLLAAGDIATAAEDARARLRSGGIVPSALALGHFNQSACVWPALVTTYASAYARRSVWQPYAGVGFAMVGADGRPRPVTDAEAATLWSDASGIAPTSGIALVAPDADGVRRACNAASVPLALAFATRRLLDAAGRSLDALLPADHGELLEAVRRGQDDVAMSARPGNRPVMLLHGRMDGLIPVNHSSRAYVALNHRERGDRDEVRYYELEHGQHFDGALSLPGLDAACVPMQAWTRRCLDLLYARLVRGEALPPSQVIRSRPRGGTPGAAPPLAAEHLGELVARPGADGIRAADGVLTIPD
jgi:hydroxybutyrate-dimer hydrolase